MTNLTTLPYERYIFAALLAVFALLAVGFSLGPIFEGPDEIEHYRFVRYLADKGSLPAPDGQPNGQYHQAPLYYALLAPLAAQLPDDDFSQIDGRLNPYHGYQFERAGNDNKNLYVHTSAETFPYASETARAVHLLRLFSVLLGTLTVALAYRIFCLLWRDAPYTRLVALLTVALWTQFAYLSSVINNDNLAILLATAACYLVLLQTRDDFTWQRSALLGCILGAALLTKSSLTLLAVPVGIAVLSQPRSWKYATLTLALTLLIAGWWYGRNYMLTGDPTGIQAMFTTWPDQMLREGEMAFDIGVQRAPYAYQTLWARFGAGSVAVAEWIYRAYDALVMAAVAGIVLRGVQIRHTPPTRDTLRRGSIIVAFAVVWILSLIMSASVASAGNQGRYLLPGIAAWAAIIAWGLDVWLARVSRKWGTLLYGAALMLLSAVSLFGYFYPAYQAHDVPETIPQPLTLRYADTAHLLGVSPALEDGVLTAERGDTITLELYWEAVEPQSATLQTYVHTAFAEWLLWHDSLPGNGHRPADDWQTGDQWADRYVFTIPADAATGDYLLTAGYYDPVTGESVSAIAPDGDVLGSAPVIATLRITEN